MKPCCQLCWRDVIVDADGHAAWCCNACALKLHAVVEAAREFKSVCEDWVQCDGWDSYGALSRALAALQIEAVVLPPVEE